jgi:hypothetical protein
MSLPDPALAPLNAEDPHAVKGDRVDALVFPVPVLTPQLSSYWLNFVTATSPCRRSFV